MTGGWQRSKPAGSSIRWSRVIWPVRSTSAVISSSERSRKARAAESCASACATCDWIRWLSRNVRLPPERNLVARQLDKGVERAARDPHRHSGKPRRIELEAAEAIEQTLLAPRFVVAGRRMPLRHEEVLDRVAGRCRSPLRPITCQMSVISGIRFREQHRADRPGCRRGCGAACRLLRRPAHGSRARWRCGCRWQS